MLLYKSDNKCVVCFLPSATISFCVYVCVCNSHDSYICTRIWQKKNYNSYFTLISALREFPLTIPEVKLYDNFTLRCPIAGSIQSHWMKKTSREDVLPFIKPSFILGFEMFNSQNQGYYYCKGVGNDNATLATEPVLLAFKGN